MPKAIPTLTAPIVPTTAELARASWAGGKWVIRQALDLLSPDRSLLAACAEFLRCQAILAAIPYENEEATDAAFAARKAVAERIANLRPTTDAGRRAKAAVALALLQEVPARQRESEVMFALAAFRAEAA